MGAYAASNATSTVFGDKKVIFCRITGSGTYTSGGDVVDPAWFGLKEVTNIIMPGGDNTKAANAGVIPTVIRNSGANPKIYLLVMGTANEFSGTNAFVFDVMVVGQ